MSKPALRKGLKEVAFRQTYHAGLWLDRYIANMPEKGDRESLYADHLADVSSISEPPFYKRFYDNWEATLKANNITTYKAAVQGRMVVGLGSESVLETSVTLHRTYGVPYIPGSALKGLAAAFAHQWLAPGLEDERWRKGGEYHNVVFGDTDEAGFITFFDALYVPPKKRGEKPLHADVITVHHQDYYGEKKKSSASAESDSGSGRGKDTIPPPADWDSPNPVSFLSATGTYLIALDGPKEWVDIVHKILQRALVEMGVGAKTSSGYGRLDMDGDKVPSTSSGTEDASVPSDPDQKKVDEIVSRLVALPANRVAGEINRFFQEWRTLTISETLKQQVAQAIINKVHDAGRKRVSEKKDWYKELVASLEGATLPTTNGGHE